MASTIKLLQVAKHFYPDRGGIETVTKNISDMLVGSGIDADVLCTAAGKTRYAPLDTPYRVMRSPRGLPISRNKSISVEYVRRIATLDRDYDVALVHMPNPLAVGALLAGWRKPIIQLWHADIPQRAIRAAARPLDAALARRSAAIIGPSPVHLAQSHRADVIVPHGIVIPYPFIDTLSHRTGAPTPLGERVREFARGRKVSLSTGRLVPYKGFEVLIRAARDFHPDLCAVIVGTGPLQDELAAAITANGVADRVMLAGNASDDELAELLQICGLGCMPSVTAAEMYGVAQVEVFSVGKPMVSTQLPRSGVPFINKHDRTGLVVAPGDVDALAAALSRLVTDGELYARLSAGAAAEFAEQHAIDAVRARYEDLIRRVVAGERAPFSASASRRAAHA